MSWVPECSHATGRHSWSDAEVVKTAVQKVNGWYPAESREVIGFKQTCKHCGVLFVNELGR